MFVDLDNYLASDLVPQDLSFNKTKKFLHDVKMFFGDETNLYHNCADGIIRCYVPRVELFSLLEMCHS